jgi:hypothetical protein
MLLHSTSVLGSNVLMQSYFLTFGGRCKSVASSLAWKNRGANRGFAAQNSVFGRADRAARDAFLSSAPPHAASLLSRSVRRTILMAFLPPAAPRNHLMGR